MEIPDRIPGPSAIPIGTTTLSDLEDFLNRRAPLPPLQLCQVIRLDQRSRWDREEPIFAEEYLQRFPALAASEEAAIDLVFAEFLIRERLEMAPTAREFLRRFPQYAKALGAQIEFHLATSAGANSARCNAEAEEEWHSYFSRLVRHAIEILNQVSDRDEQDDWAAIAFRRFNLSLESGRIPTPSRSGQMWRHVIAACRPQDQDTRPLTEDGPISEGELCRQTPSIWSSKEIFEDLRNPIAQNTEAVLARVRLLLGSLSDPVLRQIAIGNLQGLTVHEIATEIKRSEITVERKLRHIDAAWQLVDIQRSGSDAEA